jgi:glycine cleavage system aminomethyltransferase T
MATDVAASPVTHADRRAVETERQMTDDERFALIISLSGATRFSGGVRDQRYPEDAPLTAGYTPGVPRLGVPALLCSDAYGFTVGRNLAYAYLPAAIGPGDRVGVEVFGELIDADVVEDVQYDPGHERVRS